MTKKFWSAVMGVGLLMSSVGCSEIALTAPSNSTVTVLDSGLGSTASIADSYPVVTLLPDLTTDPSQVTVPAGYRVKMVNNSGRYAKMHSYNCSEFSMVNLPNGGWINTSVFNPAGKTCDYFAWDVNWSRKIFVGQVVVEP
jgi:hypothetical protein